MNRNSHNDDSVESINADIEALLYACIMNIKHIELQLSQSQQPHLMSNIANTNRIAQNCLKLLGQRFQLHLDFLITRQIQEEQAKVRRERLLEYEEKIYDQRRIIADKEVYLETLFRPKRKKPMHMSNQSFIELKERQRQKDQNLKISQIQAEIDALYSLIKKVREEAKQKNKLPPKKGKELQKTKAYSSVNLSICQPFGEHTQNTENIDQVQSKLSQRVEAKTKKACANENLTENQKIQNNYMQIILKEVQSLKEENDKLQKQSKGEREIYNYYRGLNSKLVKEYSQLQTQAKELTQQGLIAHRKKKPVLNEC